MALRDGVARVVPKSKYYFTNCIHMEKKFSPTSPLRLLVIGTFCFIDFPAALSLFLPRLICFFLLLRGLKSVSSVSSVD